MIEFSPLSPFFPPPFVLASDFALPLWCRCLHDSLPTLSCLLFLCFQFIHQARFLFPSSPLPIPSTPSFFSFLFACFLPFLVPLPLTLVFLPSLSLSPLPILVCFLFQFIHHSQMLFQLFLLLPLLSSRSLLLLPNLRTLPRRLFLLQLLLFLLPLLLRLILLPLHLRLP